MATVMTCPPGLEGSLSGAACTASSWSLASAGSIVTSGRCRQSWRPARPAGRAASASASASRGKTCGMPCAWIAIRLTARSLGNEPSRSFTRAVGRPKRPWRPISAATRSPSTAPSVAPGGMASSRPSCFLSTGESRPPPPGSARKMPSTRCLALSMILMTRPLCRIASSSSPVSSTRSSARSPTPGTSPGRVRRGTVRRILGGAPCASSSHSVGRAISSPSRSRSVTSARTVEGR